MFVLSTVCPLLGLMSAINIPPPLTPGRPLMSLGVMPPAPALASVPLVAQEAGDGAASSTAQVPATFTRGVTPCTAELDPINWTPVLPSSSVAGLSLSPATAPFPAKLVDRARSGQYVDMRDLLVDNVSLLQQLETFGSQYPVPSLPGVLRPRLREVTNLASWMYCFVAYVAMKANDQGVRDMLAYARLVIREAQRHGGSGWLDYDRVFRQQAALDPALRWNTLHPGIQASTLVGRVAGTALLCTLCREPDHSAGQCALSYLQSPPVSVHSAGPPAPVTGPRTPFRRRPETLAGICVSWNKGRCRLPGSCHFKHICATCHQPHMARDCGSTPSWSEYKTGAGGMAQVNPSPYSGPKPLF